MPRKRKPRPGAFPPPSAPPTMPPGAVPAVPLEGQIAQPGFLKIEARLDAQESEFGSELPEGYVNHLHAKELRALITERAARQIEALRLYEPLPVQDAFHASMARMRLARGSNRAGKTIVAAAECARAACGVDPFRRYPQQNGRFFCVGKDLQHIGQVMWRKLGRAGAFRIIRDPDTNLWRAFRPWSAHDAAYREKAKEAPPLIPPRLIKSISWESKKDSIPKIVKLVNGWELSFYSSLGKPPQGSDIDGFWMDEEIVDASWYPELAARILDRSGRGFWSATPQVGTDQLFELHEQSQKARADGEINPVVEEFEILLADNPHITEENKKAFSDTLSPEERLVRIGGEFALNQFKVYPEFSMRLHGVEREIEGRTWDEATRNWTRYMVVDPGHQVCAVLFAAVPPKDFGDFVYLEDELYIRDCNAAMFAERVEQKVAHKTYQAFLMDAHMAIHTELGIGRTVQQQYSEALTARKIYSVSTRSQFYLASDDVMGGVAAVKEMLRVRQDGTTRLRVLRGCLPNFEWEIKRYHNKKINGQVTDKPDQRRNNHCFVAGTLVTTDRGDLPIEDVTVGMRVLTRQGYRRVLASGVTQLDAKIWRLIASNGSILEGTAEHPIFVKKRGFVPMDGLRYLDTLTPVSEFLVPGGVQSWASTANVSESFSTERFFAATPTRHAANWRFTSRPSVAGDCTGKSGGRSTGQSREGTTSTTRMKTRSITTSTTWSALRSLSILVATIWAVARTLSAAIWTRFAPRLLGGTRPLPARSGTESMVNRLPPPASRIHTSASTAAGISSPSSLGQSFAHSTAAPPSERSPAWTTSTGNVLCAEPISWSTGTPPERPVQPHVLSVRPTGRRENVYDLTVEGAHEFFANGVLVHNCMDGLRYLAMFNPRYVKPPERKPAPCGAYLALQRKRERQRQQDGPKLIRLGPGR